jgi:hypothetical protein
MQVDVVVIFWTYILVLLSLNFGWIANCHDLRIFVLSSTQFKQILE